MAAYGTQTGRDIKSYAKENSAIIVDLRSDTLTVPTKSMKLAMFEAEVGDDVYEEDPTVKKLEEKAAQLLGKEAAIFVTSGTMGNLIAIMCHCNVRGSEAYCGSESHTFLHEQGGAAQIAGVTLCPLKNEPNGTYDLDLLKSCIRNDRLHEPISKLILVENTTNGKVLPLDWIQEVSALAKEYNLKIHLDGARFWNAVAASGITPLQLASQFDSVTFCLSKGLSAPAGSLLCGSHTFVAAARRARKVLGGGMRQVGILAAAGLVALEEIVPILYLDHKKALTFAREVNEFGEKIDFSVDMKNVQTNMVFLKIDRQGTKATEFLERLERVREGGEKTLVRGLALGSNSVRFVFYHQINEVMLRGAVNKIKEVIEEYGKMYKLEKI